MGHGVWQEGRGVLSAFPQKHKGSRACHIEPPSLVCRLERAPRSAVGRVSVDSC